MLEPLLVVFGSPKGRTELIIGGSGAKNCAEHHGNVRFGVAPQQPTKNCKKPILKPIFLAIVHFWSGEQKSRFFFSARHGGVAGVGARRPWRGCAAAAARPRRPGVIAAARLAEQKNRLYVPAKKNLKFLYFVVFGWFSRSYEFLDVTIKIYAKNYTYSLIFGPVRSNFTENMSVICGHRPGA